MRFPIGIRRTCWRPSGNVAIRSLGSAARQFAQLRHPVDCLRGQPVSLAARATRRHRRRPRCNDAPVAQGLAIRARLGSGVKPQWSLEHHRDRQRQAALVRIVALRRRRPKLAWRVVLAGDDNRCAYPILQRGAGNFAGSQSYFRGLGNRGESRFQRRLVLRIRSYRIGRAKNHVQADANSRNHARPSSRPLADVIRSAAPGTAEARQPRPGLLSAHMRSGRGQRGFDRVQQSGERERLEHK